MNLHSKAVIFDTSNKTTFRNNLFMQQKVATSENL